MLALYLVSSHSEHLSCKRVNTSNIHTQLNETTKCLFSIGQRVKGMFTDAYATYLPLLFLNKVSTVWDDCSSGAAGKPASLQEVADHHKEETRMLQRMNTRLRRKRRRRHILPRSFWKTAESKTVWIKGQNQSLYSESHCGLSLVLHAYEDHFYLL